jgi:hypothetical protein
MKKECKNKRRKRNIANLLMEIGKTTTAIGGILSIITAQSPYVILFTLGLAIIFISLFLRVS